MNTPIGLLRVVEPAREVWMRWAIISSAWCWPMTRWFSVSASLSTGLDLVLHHPADRDAGPVRDHRGHGLLVDGREDQRRLALQSPPARACSSCQLWQQLTRARSGSAQAAAPPSARPRLLELARGAFDRCAPARAAWRAARGSRSTSSFSVFQRFSSSARPRLLAASFSSRARSPRSPTSMPIGRLALEDLQLGLQRLDAPPAVLDLGRRRRAG